MSWTAEEFLELASAGCRKREPRRLQRSTRQQQADNNSDQSTDTTTPACPTTWTGRVQARRSTSAWDMMRTATTSTSWASPLPEAADGLLSPRRSLFPDRVLHDREEDDTYSPR